jgi:hypothetical protein
MRVPRNVSGAHLADTLCRRWQYTTVHQVGSHIIISELWFQTMIRFAWHLRFDSALTCAA